MSLLLFFSGALSDLVPPLAPGLVRRRFVIGEPVRATEVILADLIELRADTLNDLLADYRPFLLMQTSSKGGSQNFFKRTSHFLGLKPSIFTSAIVVWNSGELV
jgi:hypothetical protein